MPFKAFVFGYFVYLGLHKGFPSWLQCGRRSLTKCLALPALPSGVEIHGFGTDECTQIGMVMMDERKWSQGSMRVEQEAGNSQHHPLGGAEGA